MPTFKSREKNEAAISIKCRMKSIFQTDLRHRQTCSVCFLTGSSGTLTQGSSRREGFVKLPVVCVRELSGKKWNLVDMEMWSQWASSTCTEAPKVQLKDNQIILILLSCSPFILASRIRNRDWRKNAFSIQFVIAARVMRVPREMSSCAWWKWPAPTLFRSLSDEHSIPTRHTS